MYIKNENKDSVKKMNCYEILCKKQNKKQMQMGV